MSIKIIDAETGLPNIDCHVKILAGPGAGKTRWLINHIKKILHASTRLKSTRKIACITYTNVAAETILKRIGNTADRIEVATIHSFLYKHIVKPYVHLIAEEYDLNYLKVDGHDDIVLSNYSFINEWKEKTAQKRIQPDDDKLIVEAWKDLRWKFNSTEDIIVAPSYPCKIKGYNLKADSYIVYKKMMWSKGILHHDDVLFFSWQLFKKYDFLAKVVRAKFPYFFIDEFQDTSPIQVKLLKTIAQQETTVGVIGDVAQSIYKFQGADFTQLQAFELSGMETYRIEGNYRSTRKIVSLLNRLRTDMNQTAQRSEEGEDVVMIVGDKIKALQKIKSLMPSTNIHCLSRDNITNNKIRKGIDTNTAKKDLLDKLYDADGNKDRRNSILSCLKAIEYANQGFFKDAIKELRFFLPIRNLQQSEKRKASLVVLKRLIDHLSQFEEGTLMDLFTFINTNSLANLLGLRKGAAMAFYENTKYKDITAAVKCLDESGFYRTIHKAKGEEFDNVVIVTDVDENGQYNESEQLSFLLSPNMNDEEHRINMSV